MDEEGNDEIKVLSTDESLKILGELLSNESSRKMIKALIDRSMYANEIARDLELRPNLVVHHLRKMESIGLLEITSKKIIRKGVERRHFRIAKGLLVLPGTQNKDEARFLKRILRDSVRFVALGIAGLMPLALHVLNVQTDYGVDSDSDVILDLPSALVVGLAIVAVGVIIDRIYACKKN